MRRRDFDNQEPDNYSGLTGYDEMSSRRVDATVSGSDIFSAVTSPVTQNTAQSAQSVQSAPLFTPPPQSGAAHGGAAIDRLFDNMPNANSNNNAFAQQSFLQNSAPQNNFGAQQFAQNNGYAQVGGYAQNNNYGQNTPPVYGERPMVFSIERDPNGYIYEYSDRLEYYRYTGAGMVLINSVKKR